MALQAGVVPAAAVMNGRGVVNWRVVLGAGMVGMLVLPLAWLAWCILYESVQPPNPDEAKISPVRAAVQARGHRQLS